MWEGPLRPEIVQHGRAVGARRPLDTAPNWNRFPLTIDCDVGKNCVRDADLFSAHVTLDPNFDRDRH